MCRSRAREASRRSAFSYFLANDSASDLRSLSRCRDSLNPECRALLLHASCGAPGARGTLLEEPGASQAPSPKACRATTHLSWRAHSCRAVIASGVRFSGATVHFVDEEYDTGPVLAQRSVPVLPGDGPEDVAARVLVEVRRRSRRLPPHNCSSVVGSLERIRYQTWMCELTVRAGRALDPGRSPRYPANRQYNVP